MITLRNIHKSYGYQELFDGASLQINAADRYALVGPNGSGKSTLFKMLLSEIEPDGGEVSIKRGTVVGYLPQENAPVSEETVLAEALVGHDAADGRVTAKAKSVLMGLGFKAGEFRRPIKELSGGWAMRVAMARLLVREPDLLLLDEPTNHLDLDSLLWLQEYLLGYSGAVFVISHDRAFINAVCAAIVSVQEHTLEIYRGDYEAFLTERAAERRRLESAYRQQQVEIRQMRDFIDRNRVRASTANRAQSMIKRLDRLERIELPEDLKSVRIRFPQPSRTGVKALELKDLHKSYGATKVYEGLDLELERGWKTALVGHNGAGKSTLLKVLAGVIPFDSGERKLGMGVKVGYYSQHRTEQLNPSKTVLEEALAVNRDNGEQLVRTILGSFLFPGDAVYKKVKVLSGGEASRLALVKLLLDPPNVLLMDEPTTHLDMDSVEALAAALEEFQGTLCFISHDLFFINTLAEHVLHVDGGKVTFYPGNYDYFKRRQAEKRAEAPAVASKGKKGGGADGDSPGKERRRARAQQRESAREIKKIEREIEAGKTRLEKLAGQLGDPEIYKDYARVQAIGDEMHTLQENLQAKESELERLNSE